MKLINRIVVELEDEILTCERVANEYRCSDVCVTIEEGEAATACYVTAGGTPLSYVRLYLNKEFSDEALLLGDTWERSYGDLEWKKQPYSRIMPWYFFAKEADKICAYGVKVRPSALCAWSVEKGEICLTLDVCNGSRGVRLNGRKLLAAEIVTREYASDVFSACREFCKVMCDDGVKPERPVYGGNNWYYAYGNSSDEEILRDSKLLAALSENLKNRPFMVVDDGWAKNRCAGPWDELRASFKDMKKLAEDIRALNVRPGCWIRPLFYVGCDVPKEWVLRKHIEQGEEGYVLDVTVEGARKYVLDGIRNIKEWGYELLKHDFTTMDFFGGYAFQFENFMSRNDEWHFSDRTRTNAEIIVEFYKDIRKAAEGMLIMGCNTLSHLCAGLVEIQRIGDDTSGVEWERTKNMGVNTLAFRMCQHNVFYAIDADCVGITKDIAWEKNEKWLELVANSGTPLFVSLSPDCYKEEILSDLRSAFAVNAEQLDICEPIDWLYTKTPEQWKINGKTRTFEW